MKFVVAVVMLALAVGVHSSLLTAHIAPAVSYVTSSLHPGPLLAHGAYGGLGGLGPWGAPAAVSAWGVPGLFPLSQGPHGAGIAAPLALGRLGHGAGVYVAKTRGAVHTAPLPGHTTSATSLNISPAPGTH
ncbi:adult cuticle protein 1-like [Rhagoletis pomonella]|uniref:adult cuticle protein 1-like n=1 Tax=Rhagoletis pomonella TaxID=28610 RepID=UPI00177F2503|nr:adult cuticle protein 1-like [Rhagoletis pomonella]